MDAIERETLRELLPDIYEDFNPLFILPQLYTILPFDFCVELERINNRQTMVSRFIEKAFNCMTLNEIFEAFSYQNAYGFLIEKIEERLKQKYQNDEVYWPRKGKLFSRHRQELVEFRHKLKVYSLTGNQHSFDLQVNEVINLWKNAEYKNALSVRDRQKLADRYFFARDAQCENMRLTYNTGLASSDILSEMSNVAPFITNPLLATMMFLARKGSALIMSDPKSLDDVYRNYIETAEQNTELVPACRETGNVFTIQFNFNYLKYEKYRDPELKKNLFSIADKAVDHFCREEEKVASTFQNIFRIKLAHLRLGIGVLGNDIGCVLITSEDIESAQHHLSRIKIDELADRWKWGFHVAQSKIYWLHNDHENALKHARIAYDFALKGNFTTEIAATKETIKAIRINMLNESGKTSAQNKGKSSFKQLLLCACLFGILVVVIIYINILDMKIILCLFHTLFDR